MPIRVGAQRAHLGGARLAHAGEDWNAWCTIPRPPQRYLVVERHSDPSRRTDERLEASPSCVGERRRTHGSCLVQGRTPTPSCGAQPQPQDQRPSVDIRWGFDGWTPTPATPVAGGPGAYAFDAVLRPGKPPLPVGGRWRMAARRPQRHHHVQRHGRREFGLGGRRPCGASTQCVCQPKSSCRRMVLPRCL